MLATDLAKYAGLCNKIRNFLNINTLKTLLFSSIFQIALWNNSLGTGNKTPLQNLSIIVNKITRSITYNSKFCKISKVNTQQNLLKITEIYEWELGKLMYKIHNGFATTAVKEEFIASTSVHNYDTRVPEMGTCGVTLLLATALAPQLFLKGCADALATSILAILSVIAQAQVHRRSQEF